MGIAHADGALTVAVAAVTAVVLGVGGRLVDADGPEPMRAPRVTADGRPIASIGGCEVTARPEGGAAASRGEAVVILSVRNPGGTGAEVEIVVAIEKRELRPEAALRRVISADDMVVTEVARESARIAVPAGETVERPWKLHLPAGQYSVSARHGAEPGVGTALCSLSVPDGAVPDGAVPDGAVPDGTEDRPADEARPAVDASSAREDLRRGASTDASTDASSSEGREP